MRRINLIIAIMALAGCGSHIVSTPQQATRLRTCLKYGSPGMIVGEVTRTVVRVGV